MRHTIATGMGADPAPLLVRLGGKLVLEVLPAALASAIGAFLFAQYQFDRGAAVGQAATPAVAVPASPEMLQLVREEHAMVRDFLTAQQAAEQNRAVVANAADAQAAAAADGSELTAAVPQQAELPNGAKVVTSHKRTIVAAPGVPEAAALPQIVVAGARPAVAGTEPAPTSATAQPDAALWPAPPPPAHPSIVAETLAVPGHVMSVTLHAVMAIGGIPSWLGHRFGDDAMSTVAMSSSSAS